MPENVGKATNAAENAMQPVNECLNLFRGDILLFIQ